MNYKKIVLRILFLLALSILTNPAEVAASGASLEFSPKKIELLKGERKTVAINLDPKNQGVIGVDVKLRYNPTYIKIITVNDLHVFSYYPAVTIDNNNGTAKFSFSNSFGKVQNNRVDFAELIIEGVNPSSDTELSFVYADSSTTDTNIVVSGGLDVLDKVTGLSVFVKTINTQNGNSSPSNQTVSTNTGDTLSVTSEAKTAEKKEDKNDSPKVRGVSDENSNMNGQPDGNKSTDGANNLLDSIKNSVTNNSSTGSSYFLYVLIFISGIAAGAAVYFIAQNLKSKNG